MPTTPIKNCLYRLALPFCAPRPDRQCLVLQQGHSLMTGKHFVRIIRRHHVLGSSTLLSTPEAQMLLCTRSVAPDHLGTPDLYYRVASITKMASSLVALRSVQQGLCTLDDSICDFLPPEGRIPSLAQVTLRQLLSHTSGLLDPVNLDRFLEERVPFPQLFQSGKARTDGSGFHYSNLGFGLIGCILEYLWQKPIQDVFRHMLFEPFQLSATLDASSLSDTQIMPVVRILPYQSGREMIRTRVGSLPLTEPEPLLHYGYTAGSMYIRIQSLHRLMELLVHRDPALLSEALYDEMFTVHGHYGSLSPTLSYGLGLLLIEDEKLSTSRIWGHQGFAYGCADGAFWEEDTGNMMIMLNGGCSEARCGRLGLCNRDLLRWAFRKELPKWK